MNAQTMTPNIRQHVGYNTRLGGPKPMPVGHTAYMHVGADATTTTTNPDTSTLWQWVRMGIIGLAAYHGYKRNNSVGWAVGWALLAGLSPPITIAVAVAEGFAKPKRSST